MENLLQIREEIEEQIGILKCSKEKVNRVTLRKKLEKDLAQIVDIINSKENAIKKGSGKFKPKKYFNKMRMWPRFQLYRHQQQNQASKPWSRKDKEIPWETFTVETERQHWPCKRSPSKWLQPDKSPSNPLSARSFPGRRRTFSGRNPSHLLHFQNLIYYYRFKLISTLSHSNHTKYLKIQMLQQQIIQRNKPETKRERLFRLFHVLLHHH